MQLHLGNAQGDAFGCLQLLELMQSTSPPYHALARDVAQKSFAFEDSKAYQRIMFVYSVRVDQHYQITRSTLDGNGVWQKALQRGVEAF